MKKNNTKNHVTPIQLKLPVDLERIIEISDPVYVFKEVMENLDRNQYFPRKERETGRPRYSPEKLLSVVLFAFMEFGYCSVRRIEKLCKTDIRFMWLLGDAPPPSFMTIENFIKDCLQDKIERILGEINGYIFEKRQVDLNHAYIDGTKIEANANKYSWVWKKSAIKSRDKVFGKLSGLLEDINQRIACQGVKLGPREEYTVEYVELIQDQFLELTGLSLKAFVKGKGTRKGQEQRIYEKLEEYRVKLAKYREQITTCGEKRNSYSKTDHAATFMRVKRDYMGNDQLLPAYNLQLVTCDEFIAHYDVFSYASDGDCFQPLMEGFQKRYGFYPRYPVGDAGYGSYNNYLYCENHGMEKFMKFTMFDKESKDKKYRENPYRARNFATDEEGYLVCPKGKRFHFLRAAAVRGNQYGREEEYYQCESCEGCPDREKCHKSKGNRIVRVNEELTRFHEEVLGNLNSIHGALLRMNRSIQSEGAFGEIKWNQSYKRLRRRGKEGVMLEFGLICCGFNLHKYYLKTLAVAKAAA